MRYLLFAFAAFLLGCSEPPFRLHEKLDACLQEDLKVMVAEVVKGSGKDHLLDKPYYVIADLRFFEGDTAKIYAAYAEVDFHYYKDIELIQKRKYRYEVRRHYWDRYFKKMVSSPKGTIPLSATKSLEN